MQPLLLTCLIASLVKGIVVSLSSPVDLVDDVAEHQQAVLAQVAALKVQCYGF
jgi:hypothetical protein